MKIAVDLDGVVFDTENWFRAYANIFNLEVNGGKVKNKNALWVEDRFNWDEETLKKYVEECACAIEQDVPFLPFAKEVLSAIEKKNEIFVITGRGNFHEEEIQTTKDRFERENLKFEKILFNQKSKVQTCIENKIDLIIEDYPKNIRELSKSGIKCIYFRDFVAKKIRRKNVVEVRDWGEVAAELIKLGVIERKDLKIELKKAKSI